MTQKYESPDLEAAIMEAWHTKDDLDLISERILDDPKPMTEDEIANVLIGLSELHETRCKKLFNIFETMVYENCFNNKADFISKGLNDG